MRRPIALLPLLFLLLILLVGCTTLRGRADDAMKKGDYRLAAQLYAELLREKPNDGALKAHLTAAERGWLDQMLDRAEVARKSANPTEALAAGLEALRTKDQVHPEALDAPRPERLTAILDWSRQTIRASVQTLTSRGRALAARARRKAFTSWLARPELAALGPEIDASITQTGIATCARATATAGENAFALELVAAYCKEVGGPLPAWKARPLLVGGVTLEGTIAGTPVGENAEVERVVVDAVEHSVWFTRTSSLRAIAKLQGTVSARFTSEQVELSRSWTESVPYEATETYQEAVQVPYMETETYYESVPYTAFEDHLEQCPPPRQGQCNVSHKVTRYRDEQRTRQVQKYRTDYQNRTRQVTRYRDEPRLFRFPATKKDARYQASFSIRVDLGSGQRPVDARATSEDAVVAYDHNSEFAPANVHPEHGVLPSAQSWRQTQRENLRTELLRSLDTGWAQSFCTEGVSSIEDAARCVHGRSRPIPQAVRAQLEALFGDDPDLILGLPRPNEAVQ